MSFADKVCEFNNKGFISLGWMPSQRIDGHARESARFDIDSNLQILKRKKLLKIFLPAKF